MLQPNDAMAALAMTCATPLLLQMHGGWLYMGARHFCKYVARKASF